MLKSDLRTFFIDRIRELYNRRSLDSYRVSCHNSISLLEELIRVIGRWQTNKIKQAETVIACVQETKESIENDDCIDFTFSSKTIFIDECSKYETSLKNSAKNKYAPAQQLLFYLNKCLDTNKDLYLSRIFDKIESIIFSSEDLPEEDFIPCVNQLDYLIKSLACELLQRGFSKVYLYNRVNKRLKLNTFSSDFKDFRKRVETEGSIKYTVILKVRIPETVSEILPETVFIKDVPQEYKASTVSKILNPGTSVRFFIDTVESMDQNAAVKLARNHLATVLDTLHLGLFSLNAEVQPQAVVMRLKNGLHHTTVVVTHYILDGNYSNLIEVSSLFGKHLQSIKANPNISNDVKDRLESALRHLRLGNIETENEQRFINYWIALEFIFSSAYNEESTFSRLKENLLKILSSCYIKRNLYYLNNTLQKHKLLNLDEFYWEKDDVDNYILSQTRLLFRYRLQKLKSRVFNKSQDIKEYIRNHEKRLTWHLTRIYRLRNELIHEAAMITNIEDITSNLRFYLVFLLNQMIIYYKDIPLDSKQLHTIDEFFMEYDMYHKMVSTELDLKTILKVPLETELIK